MPTSEEYVSYYYDEHVPDPSLKAGYIVSRPGDQPFAVGDRVTLRRFENEYEFAAAIMAAYLEEETS